MRYGTITTLCLFILTSPALAQPAADSDAPHRVGARAAFEMGNELVATGEPITPQVMSDAMKARWEALAERYKDDKVASFDARLALTLYVISINMFDVSGALLQALLLESVDLPTHPEPMKRALYAQGVLGVNSMIAGLSNLNERSRTLVSQGRALVREAALHEDMAGVYGDWLDAQWSVVEPLNAARDAVADRAINDGEARGDHGLVMAVAFNAALRSRAMDRATAMLDRSLDAAKQASRNREAAAIALYQSALLNRDPAVVEQHADELFALLPASGEKAAADIAVLVAMTSILAPRDADRAMRYAERAAAQAETELTADNPLRATARFTVARLRHNAGEATPPGYDGPDPDTHGVAATLGFIFAGSPWDVGRVPALSADVAVQPLPEAPAETGTP